MSASIGGVQSVFCKSASLFQVMCKSCPSQVKSYSICVQVLSFTFVYLLNSTPCPLASNIIPMDVIMPSLPIILPFNFKNQNLKSRYPVRLIVPRKCCCFTTRQFSRGVTYLLLVIFNMLIYLIHHFY